MKASNAGFTRHPPSVFRFILAAFLLCVSPIMAEPKDVSGKVVGVHDGDTLTVLTADKVEVKVRLEGIDAPELKQAFGNKSKEALSKLAFGKEAVVHVTGHDRYRRTLGRVEVAGVDINLQMTKDGVAWHYVKYSKDPALAKAQAETMGAKRGFWLDAAPVAPWDFRKPKAVEAAKE